MKFRHACLTFCLLLSLFLSAGMAQADANKKAKALYFAAEQAYTEKNYDNALIGIKAVEALLGSSNALLQGLRVKALVSKGDYEGAKQALDTFFTLDASDDLAREIAPYLIKVEKKLEEGKKAREAAAAEAKLEALKKAAAKAKIEAQKKTGFLDLTFGGKGPDSARSLVALPDGGFLVAGATGSRGEGEVDAWILRLDGLGQLLWEKTYASKGSSYASSIAALPDGGFVVAGATLSEDKTQADGWAMRLDAQGRRIWKKTLGGEMGILPESIAALPGGGLVIAGRIQTDRGIMNARIWRLDGQGRLLWEKSFGGKATDFASSIVSLPDGGFIVAGTASSKGAGKFDAWVLRFDSDGKLLWDKTFGGKESDAAVSIAALADGEFVVAGQTDSKGAGAADIWVLKLNGQGQLLWEKTFGGKKADSTNSVVALPDGGFVVAGQTGSKGAGGIDAWILKLDGKGRLLGEKTFGGKKSDAAHNIVALPDGWLAISGYTDSKGAGREDLWFFMMQLSQMSLARQK